VLLRLKVRDQPRYFLDSGIGTRSPPQARPAFVQGHNHSRLGDNLARSHYQVAAEQGKKIGASREGAGARVAV